MSNFEESGEAGPKVKRKHDIRHASHIIVKPIKVLVTKAKDFKNIAYFFDKLMENGIEKFETNQGGSDENLKFDSVESELSYTQYTDVKLDKILPAIVFLSTQLSAQFFVMETLNRSLFELNFFLYE